MPTHGGEEMLSAGMLKLRLTITMSTIKNAIKEEV